MARSKTTTIGYIVETRGYRAMEMVEHGATSNHGLYFGSIATVFNTRDRAKRAIRITLERTADFETRFGDLEIMRLIAE